MEDTLSRYDIIGDIHGRWDKLEPLLTELGYHHDGVCHLHSEGRTVIFLGDLIDPRGDHANGTREVLGCVRDMMAAGQAQCILGNHEYNFVAYHAPDGQGGFLREHSKKNERMHHKTHEAFANHPDEIEEVWLPWMKTLPFFLDLPDLRVVHACWHAEHLELLSGYKKGLADERLLRKSSRKDTREFHAVEAVLKGVELPMPEGESFPDHAGNPRTEFRARWWGKGEAQPTPRSMVFPPREDFSEMPLDADAVSALPGYGRSEKPLFIGHYYKPAASPRHPEAANLCCLDFSAAENGALTAYRFDGPQDELNAGCMVFCGPVENTAAR